MAVASPPPMHRLATPRLPPYFLTAPISVTRMRAPEQPIGWPRAQAPPCTFTFSCGSLRSCIAAMVTTAKASLIVVALAGLILDRKGYLHKWTGFGTEVNAVEKAGGDTNAPPAKQP